MELKIFVDRLKEGSIEKLEGEVPPDFLEVGDQDLKCTSPVKLKGQAYIATDHLLIQLHIETKISMPCSICNEPTEIKINIPDFTQVEPLSEIPSSVFDYTDLVREDILLSLPQFTECHDGKCPERDLIKNYLKKEEKAKKPASEEAVHFPFSDL